MEIPCPIRIIGNSQLTSRLRNRLQQAACGRGGVLLTGEPGAGKELGALVLHSRSSRANGPLRVVDCAHFFPDDLARILFGSASRPGTAILSRADKGTLYLAHPEEMVMPAQERICEFLETGEFTVGESEERRSADVRIVAGTEKDIQFYLRGGTFLKELWEYLSSFTVRVAPLRERIEDIGAIVEYLVGGNLTERFAPGVLPALKRYSWPGNYDELIEEVARLLRTGYGCIEMEHLRRDIVDYRETLVSGDPEILKATQEIEQYIRAFHVEDERALDFDPYFRRGGPVPPAASSGCNWAEGPEEEGLTW